MKKIVDFVEKYYDNNLKFDQKGFLFIIEMLINNVDKFTSTELFNNSLSKIMESYQRQDYYLVIQIIEYEIIPYINGKFDSK